MRLMLALLMGFVLVVPMGCGPEHPGQKAVEQFKRIR